MKTIHIKTKNKSIIKKLYRDILNKDSEFHFFYEPELIIRTNKVRKVRKWLHKNKIKHRVYDYPMPVHTEGNYCYECEPFTRNNIDFFKQIYHFSSMLVNHATLLKVLTKATYANYRKSNK